MRGESRLSKVILYSLPIIVLVLFSFAVWITNNPQASEQYCQSHKTSAEECAHHSPGIVAMLWIVDFLNLSSPAITALSGIAVAAFTYALWVSTDKLWQASRDGQADLLRSIIASEKTADAAQRSADASIVSANAALVNMSRPWLVAQIIENGVESFNPQQNPFLKVGIVFENHGDVFAEIIEAWASIRVWNGWPCTLEAYEREKRNFTLVNKERFANNIVRPKGTSKIIECRIGLRTDKFLRGIFYNKPENSIAVIGQVFYLGPLGGDVKITAFSFRLNFMGDGFIVDATSGYHYRT